MSSRFKLLSCFHQELERVVEAIMVIAQDFLIEVVGARVG